MSENLFCAIGEPFNLGCWTSIEWVYIIVIIIIVFLALWMTELRLNGVKS